MAGTVLGSHVHGQGALYRQHMKQRWEDMQTRSYIDPSLLGNENDYNAMFSPFPEGNDAAYQDLCYSYWINIPNVDTTVNNIHIMAFLIACRHVSTPGSGGDVSEHILTAPRTTADFCLFYERTPYASSLSHFVTQFHVHYLHQANATHHLYGGTPMLPMEQRQNHLSSQCHCISSSSYSRANREYSFITFVSSFHLW